jgi:DNA-binding transcriptional ArsR family regulator
MRIIQTLAGDTQLTAQQMAETLQDVPQATLYRHLNKLAQADIVKVVAEHPIRGTVEKVYALLEQTVNLEAEDIAIANREEHMRYFTTFVASQLNDFARYLQRDKIDLSADGVFYTQVALYLSDAEFQELMSDMMAVISAKKANEPTSDRHRRLISTITIPTVEIPLNPQQK